MAQRCCDSVLLDQHVLHLIVMGRLVVIWNHAAMCIFGWEIVSVHIHVLQLAAKIIIIKSTCLRLILAAGIDRKKIIYIYQFVLRMMMKMSLVSPVPCIRPCLSAIGIIFDRSCIYIVEPTTMFSRQLLRYGISIH